MAIVRMVNGISDKAQKGKTATSVSSNAAAAGALIFDSPQVLQHPDPQFAYQLQLQPLTQHTRHYPHTSSIVKSVLQYDAHLQVPCLVVTTAHSGCTSQEGLNTQSSTRCCAGLPRLLVDVRHEASHNDMPSLSVLRLAAAQALEWLLAAYWQRQEAHLQQQKCRVVQLLQVPFLKSQPVTPNCHCHFASAKCHCHDSSLDLSTYFVFAHPGTRGMWAYAELQQASAQILAKSKAAGTCHFIIVPSGARPVPWFERSLYTCAYMT